MFSFIFNIIQTIYLLTRTKQIIKELSLDIDVDQCRNWRALLLAPSLKHSNRKIEFVEAAGLKNDDCNVTSEW